MAFQGTTGVVAQDRQRTPAPRRTVGAQTDAAGEGHRIRITFQLPNAKVVRVDGLAEVYEYMLKNGKWVMPDCQVVLRTDITAGAPVATGLRDPRQARGSRAPRPARSRSPSRPA